ADFDSMLRRGVGHSRDLAMYGITSNPLNQSGGVMDLYRNTFAKDGYNDAQRTAMEGLSGPSYSEQNLAGIARGDFLDREDPNFERLLNRASERAATEASMTASGMGRTGSDYHQGLVAERVGDTEANA